MTEAMDGRWLCPGPEFVGVVVSGRGPLGVGEARGAFPLGIFEVNPADPGVTERE